MRRQEEEYSFARAEDQQTGEFQCREAIDFGRAAEDGSLPEFGDDVEEGGSLDVLGTGQSRRICSPFAPTKKEHAQAK